MSHHTDPGRFVITPPTPEQQHAAAIACAGIALDVDADRDELADVLAMLGLKDYDATRRRRNEFGRLIDRRGDSVRSTAPLTAWEASGVVGGAGGDSEGLDGGKR